MTRVRALAMVMLFAMITAGCASVQSLGGPEILTQLLSSELGVTGNQAAGGAGSVLTLAKERLTSTAFNSLSSLIPGADALMKSAKDLGAVTGPLQNRAGLEAAFGKLGMAPSMVDKFSGVMGNFVGQAGGDTAKNLLLSILK